MEPKQKQQTTTPMAMAELEIMKLDSAKSTADKSPKIRNIAFLLLAVLGVNLFSQLIAYSLVASFGGIQVSLFSLFVGSNGILGMTHLLIQVVAIFTLLSTRNTSHAKTILLVTGISFGVTLVSGIISFQIGPSIINNAATLVINFFVLLRVFKVYLDL